ncbi:ATP-binding protein [Polyangium jinanense]|uniref:Tetratricopeptide repeat protein n=1 Tax=Polyangium jinanense TaxID=2829994 RepID=A0A9X3XES4_9BACT|nr:tetratricopeptide repeat protein [Polyangium jinanense]MDC3959220.1 tetratricopeptide repeat protein [Polyangium jinanense]MDC3987688.1 tetratricopeptide repeat protein [Polyangium jinanense]
MGAPKQERALRGRPRLGERGFVGRGADLARVGQLIAEGAPLVTLTGTAGIGKTALAARLAAMLEDPSQDEPLRVGFCDLEGARGAAGIRAAVARAIGVPDPEGAFEHEWMERMVRSLAAFGPALLVLDHFEHVVEHADATVGAWLACVPELQLLVTSRERLRIPGEVVHDLAPLSLPERNDLAGSEAVELWIARVREVYPSYDPTPADAPVVVRLVRELDGLPLAIELAAARFGTLTPAELLERLERRIDVLGRRGKAGGRQSTLRDAIDWSWGLLPPWEQEAFAQCAVFHGRISVDAAEAVLDPGGDDALEALQGLRDKSLLSHARYDDHKCETGLTMYLSVRKYAEEKLAASEGRTAVFERHTRYFLAYAERCAALTRIDPSAAARRLLVERENLLAVVRRGLSSSSPKDVEAALRILVALEEPRWHDGSPSAHLLWLDEALAHPSVAEVDPRVRGHALIARGRVAWRVARLDVSERDFDEAVALAVRAKDASLESLARRFLALVLLLRGRFDESRGAADHALRLAIDVGDRRLEGLAYAMLGFVARLRGEQPRARRRVEQALERFRDVGEAPFELSMRLELMYVHLDAGELEAARAYAEQALAHSQALGLAPPPRLLLGLGHAALEAGDPSEASLRYRDARDVARAAGEHTLEVAAIACGAVTLFEQGRPLEARLELREALPRVRTLGRHVYSGLVTVVSSVLEAAVGHIDEARELLAAAERDLDAGADTHLPALEICKGFLDLAEAQRARTNGDGGAAAELEGGAQRRLGAVLATANGAGSRWVTELRVLARLLGSALATHASPAPAAPRVLRLDATGRWFEPPSGPRVACANRPVMRRLLVALAQAHLAAPARPFSFEELIEIGWPGERILADAARNRLHVMLTRMRDLGLREVLLGNDLGYFFSPDLSIDFC